MKKIIISFCMLVFFASGCEDSGPDQIDKKIDIKNSASIDKLKSIEQIDEILDFKTIELETNEDVLVGRVLNYALDKYDNIYIVDNNNTIFKFNIEGKVLNKFKAVGGGPGEYKRVNNIIVNDKGNIIIEDEGGLKFIQYDSSFQFIKNIPKQVFSRVSDWIIHNDSLICFYSLINIYDNLEEPIYIYDLDLGEIVYKGGIVSSIQKKYDVREEGGSLFMINNFIYYQFPLEYQIYAVKDSKDYQLFRNMPDNFKAIEKNYDVYNPTQNYTLIYKTIVLDDLLVVNYYPPMNDNLKRTILYDVYDLNGDMLKAKLETKEIFGLFKSHKDKMILINNYQRKVNEKMQTSNPLLKVITLKD